MFSILPDCLSGVNQELHGRFGESFEVWEILARYSQRDCPAKGFSLNRWQNQSGTAGGHSHT